MVEDPAMEEIAYGVTREWLMENRIVVYSLELMNAMAIRIWSNEALFGMELWSKEQPYLAIHDLSNCEIGLSYMTLARGHLLTPGITAQGSTQLRKLMTAHPDFRIWLAVVLSRNYAEVLAPYMDLRRTSSDPRVTTSLFFERPAAEQWLNLKLVLL
jgi:hypothetical protein